MSGRHRLGLPNGRMWFALGRGSRVAFSLLVVASLLASALLLTANVPTSNPKTPLPTPGHLTPAWRGSFVVSFVETGLPSANLWAVTVDSLTKNGTTPTLAFHEKNGTHTYSVGVVPGFVAHPSHASFVVQGAPLTIGITFTRTVASYLVNFTATGLAPGTAWSVVFNGTGNNSTTMSITFTVPNGSYAYTVASPIYGALGVRYVAATPNGTVHVAGTNQTLIVPFSTEFFLRMGVSPNGSGNVTPSSGWHSAGSPVIITAFANSSWLLIGWNGTGNGSYSGPQNSSQITMNGPINETAFFAFAFAVNFEEHGLPEAFGWNVTFNGTTQTSNYFVISFGARNGTYPFTIGPIPGYHANLYAGTVVVAGAPQTILVVWSLATYPVTFLETGLPSGTLWSVSLDGTGGGSTGSTIAFQAVNGTKAFTVTPIPGFHAQVYAGSVKVSGLAVTVEIDWQPVTFTVTFIETGFPSLWGWSVGLTLGGPIARNGTTPSISFDGVPNGTYAYAVPSVGVYHPAIAAGSVTVNGADVTVSVLFTHVSPPRVASSQYSTISTGLALLILLLIVAMSVVVWYQHRGRSRRK